MMNPLQPLVDLAALNLQPIRREIWIGLGYKPPKRCAIAIDPDHLPTVADCWAVAGLDVIVVYHGFCVRFDVLHGLCGILCQALPRRLLVVDVDIKCLAFLVLAPV